MIEETRWTVGDFKGAFRLLKRQFKGCGAWKMFCEDGGWYGAHPLGCSFSEFLRQHEVNGASDNDLVVVVDPENEDSDHPVDDVEYSRAEKRIYLIYDICSVVR